MAERKSVAPQEHGELPNEKRCPACWNLLSLYIVEDPGAKPQVYNYCSRCQKILNRVEEPAK